MNDKIVLVVLEEPPGEFAAKDEPTQYSVRTKVFPERLAEVHVNADPKGGYLSKSSNLADALRSAADKIDPPKKSEFECPYSRCYCWEGRCRIWNADLGQCNIAVPGYLQGREIIRKENAGDHRE